MSKLKVYGYAGCSTCKSAWKALDAKNVDFENIPIVEKPPSIAELKRMLEAVGMKRLFNTSGQQYREMGLSEKLPKMSEKQALELLSKNGKLIKRPFAISARAATTGFKPDEWKKLGLL